MKNIFYIILLVTTVFASDYKEFAKKMGYETSYVEAIKKAKKENKDVFVLIVTNYCPWCAKLEKRVLSKKEVDDKLKNKYIRVIINKEEVQLKKDLASPIVPAMYMLNIQDENIYDSYVGYLKKSELLHIIKRNK